MPKYTPVGDEVVKRTLAFPAKMQDEEGNIIDVETLMLREGILKQTMPREEYIKLDKDEKVRNKKARQATANAVLQLAFQGHRQIRDEDLGDLINSVAEATKTQNEEEVVE